MHTDKRFDLTVDDVHKLVHEGGVLAGFANNIRGYMGDITDITISNLMDEGVARAAWESIKIMFEIPNLIPVGEQDTLGDYPEALKQAFKAGSEGFISWLNKPFSDEAVYFFSEQATFRCVYMMITSLERIDPPISQQQVEEIYHTLHKAETQNGWYRAIEDGIRRAIGAIYVIEIARGRVEEAL